MITLHLAGILLYIFSPLFFGPIRSSRFENVQLSFIAHNALIASFFYVTCLSDATGTKEKRRIFYAIAGIVSVIVFALISHYVREGIRDKRSSAYSRVRSFPYVGLAFPYGWLGIQYKR